MVQPRQKKKTQATKKKTKPLEATHAVAAAEVEEKV
jgi:hypothetical protein